VLTLQFINTSGASATPVAGNYLIEIIRNEGPIPTVSA
jgi:hypothetical protein